MNHTIGATKLENKVWNAVVELLLNPQQLYEGYRDALTREQADRNRQLILIQEYQKKLGKIEQMKQNLIRMYTDPEIGMPKNDYIAQREQLDGEQKTIIRDMNELQGSISDLPTPQEFSDLENFTSEIREKL